MKRLLIYTVLLIGLFVISCKKNPPLPPSTPERYENGVLALNEGLFEQNNASISFYDGTEVYQQVFKSENNRGLGDTANDFETYEIGGLEYIIIAVDVSSQVEIIDRFSLKTVAQIPLFDGINAREPRRVLVDGVRAFVCNFDGTVAVIDLLTYEVIKLVHVGTNPDAMVLKDDKLYVANSGGLLFPVYDSTMSVINTNSLTVETTFETRINASEMVLDAAGEIYLVSQGDYEDVPNALVRINTETNTVIETIEMEISALTLVGNWLYYYNRDESGIFRMNTMTEEFDPEMKVNLTGYETFFGWHYDPNAELFYGVDAQGYVNSSTIHVYDMLGNEIDQFKGGLNTTDLIFNHE